MSHLKNKSEFNITAAQFLIDRNLYAPSIHCSYYSCFQLLKVILKEFIGIDYNQQERAIRMGQQNSHSYVITNVLNVVHDKNRLAYPEISRKIKNLRLLREKADYRDIQIDQSTSLDAYNTAKEVLSYLNKKML